MNTASSDKLFGDRRRNPRWVEHAGCVVSVAGSMGRLVDASAEGARVETGRKFSLGETVRFDLPWGKIVTASVVDCAASQIRLRFGFPIDEPI